MMKTLFLHPPSFDGFDGGAGARYQAKREIKSFWFPTWLAQPAALVPGSKLIDAPPAAISLETVAGQARDYELCVIHTSTPSFASDVKVAEAKAVRFDLGEALLQIAVVLSSITLFTRRRSFFVGGLALGVAGVVVAASAWLVR